MRAARSGSYRVDVPFLTSHIMHLNASAVFLKVQTLQSQQPSSDGGLQCLFGLQTKHKDTREYGFHRFTHNRDMCQASTRHSCAARGATSPVYAANGC